MKRVIPEEVTKLRFWLLAEKRFDEANIVSNIIGCMESGIGLSKENAETFKRLLQDYKDAQASGKPDIESQLYEHFTKRYGLKNAQFIMGRLRSAIGRYTFSEIADMGYKIALFNGWAK